MFKYNSADKKFVKRKKATLAANVWIKIIIAIVILILAVLVIGGLQSSILSVGRLT